MGVVGALVRAELGIRWRAAVALALLVGVVVGVAGWSAAAARRTDSAYWRLAAATNADDVLVNPAIDGWADASGPPSVRS